MIDVRTTEHISPSTVTELRVVHDGFTGMWRVIATVPTHVPPHHIVWEPNLYRLTETNTEAAARQALAQLRGTRQ